MQCNPGFIYIQHLALDAGLKTSENRGISKKFMMYLTSSMYHKSGDVLYYFSVINNLFVY
jgi:hypothetical protein